MKFFSSVKRRIATRERGNGGESSESYKDEFGGGNSSGTIGVSVGDEKKSTDNGKRSDMMMLQTKLASVSIVEEAGELPLAGLQERIALCKTLYDYHIDPKSDLTGKECKRRYLLEIVEHLNNPRAQLSSEILPDLIEMISVNIFRPATCSVSEAVTSLAPEAAVEEDDPVLDPAWPHLQLVYEILLRILISPNLDSRTLKEYISHNFVYSLIELCSVEDPRERDYLKTILHRLYGKIMSLRTYIRKLIQNVFFRYIYEGDKRPGISELLEIFGSIINGFALPLKEEHKQFLKTVLLPLHKVQVIPRVHEQLSYCVVQYAEKDNSLVCTAVLALLKYWPTTNTTKEVAFLSELEDLLDLAKVAQFQRLMVPLAERLTKCIISQHFQVAERALFLWNNENFVKHVIRERITLYPIILEALYTNSRFHWSTAVQGLTYNVSKVLAAADSQLFDSCTEKFLSEENAVTMQKQARLDQWNDLVLNYEGPPPVQPSS